MDELWQRHKTFIVQCLIGGIAFLIGYFVMTSSYDGIEQTQTGNQNLKSDLTKRIQSGKVPDPPSIKAQKQKAEDAQSQIRSMLAKVASTAQGEAFVRENCKWVLQIIGKPNADTEVEAFLDLYRKLPLTCLTTVREEARSVLVSAAAQRGRQIDETFGLAGGVEPDEVPSALHALAIVCDVIAKSMELDRIASISDIRVAPRNVLDRDLDWIQGAEIRMTISGEPEDVNRLIRGFNRTDSRSGRMTVLKEIESIARKNPDEDTVKAVIVLLALHGKADEGVAR